MTSTISDVDMNHERARFIFTVIGAIAPIIFLLSTPILLYKSGEIAAIGGFLIIISSFLIIIGQAAFVAMAFFWNCSACDKQYFEFFMPYWPFKSSCQNCGESD